jgi:hypothetical protein
LKALVVVVWAWCVRVDSAYMVEIIFEDDSASRVYVFFAENTQYLKYT